VLKFQIIDESNIYIIIDRIKYKVISNKYNPIYLQWIYNVDSCLLLQNGMEHKILVIYKNIKEDLPKKLKPPWNVSLKLITDFKPGKDDQGNYLNIEQFLDKHLLNKFYLIDIHYTGLYCIPTNPIHMFYYLCCCQLDF
jgi:hypothetical protein